MRAKYVNDGENVKIATASSQPTVPSQRRHRKVSPTSATPKTAGTARAVASVAPKSQKLPATERNWNGPCSSGLYL
jgi:hypothetical protein